MAVGTAAAILGGAGIVGNIIGGIAGKNAGAGDAGEARNAANLSFSELQKIGYPPDEAKKIIYEQFHQAGLLTPDLEQHIEEQASKMADVKTDPALKEASMNALKILSERGKGGLNPEDRAALNKIRSDIATDTEAKRQQIIQNFAARGQGGSGAELIAALQGSQAGANSESEAGDRLAAMTSQNALQAIGQAGTLSGQIRSQDFGEEAEKAKAQDAINAFNTQNAVNTGARNVATKNQAQATNLQNAQNISNANTQQENQERLREQEAKRQQYLDEMNMHQVKAGGSMAQANYLQGASQAASAQAAAPWQAIGLLWIINNCWIY
jgi:hypothetical protein